jgi:chromosome segregation ATPase
MKIKNSVNSRYLILIGAFFFLIILVPSVFAVGKPNTVGKSETVTGRPSNVGNSVTGVQEERRQQAQNRLTEAKLKVCQAKEKSIKNRFTHLNNLTINIENKFDSIASRVEDYYTSKVVPTGKTVSNYDTLVSDIQTKKTAVQTALTTAQNNVSGFSCTGDPKGQLTQFRKDMQSVKSALKEYRTSIKNLIVAVHSVTGNIESENADSPKPTKTE